MTGNLVHTLPELRILVRQELGADSAVAGAPTLAAIVGAIHAAGRHGDEHTLPVAGMRDDRMEAQTTAAGLPLGAVFMRQKSVDGRPTLAGVSRLEQTRRLDSRPEKIRLVSRTG